MKIRRRDGSMVEVADNYILADGETMHIDIAFMDARSIIHDGNGGPVGQRPGFLIRDDDQDEAARIEAYESYRQMIGQRWRQGLGQPAKPIEPPQTFANPEAALAAAYAQYDRTICERWRK